MTHTSPSTESGVDRNRNNPDSYQTWWKSPRLQTAVALVLALIAVGVAVAAWFRPTHETVSYPQSGNAKTNLCNAYTVVRQGVVFNTHLANPGGNDPTGQFAVAANARLALLGGGEYLRVRLAAQTNPPADLAKAINNMAVTVEQLGINYLANADDSLQVPLRHDLDGQIQQLNKMCA